MKARVTDRVSARLRVAKSLCDWSAQGLGVSMLVVAGYCIALGCSGSTPGASSASGNAGGQQAGKGEDGRQGTGRPTSIWGEIGSARGRVIAVDELPDLMVGDPMQDCLMLLDGAYNFECRCTDDDGVELCLVSVGVALEADHGLGPEFHVILLVFRDGSLEKAVRWVGGWAEEASSLESRDAEWFQFARELAIRVASQLPIELHAVKSAVMRNAPVAESLAEAALDRELADRIHGAAPSLAEGLEARLSLNALLRTRYDGARVPLGASCSVIEEALGKATAIALIGGLEFRRYVAPQDLGLSYPYNRSDLIVVYKNSGAVLVLANDFVVICQGL